MTGLDSIAMAVAHLESKDEDGDKQPEEAKSGGGYTPNGAYFAEAQPRLVSLGDAAIQPIAETKDAKYDETKINAGTGEDERHSDTNQATLDHTTKEETCHDTTFTPGRKTETIIQHNFRSPTTMQLMQQYRPIALDLTTPPDAAQMMMMRLNDGVHHTLGPAGNAGLATSHLAGENPRRMPNQISQKILLKHQTEDGAADDPIADVLSRISHITSDLPLLFSLMEELCEIGVAEHGPPAEVVPATTPIDKIERCDVLSGRGGETNHHYGNGKSKIQTTSG
jgi:hypothetical protein